MMAMVMATLAWSRWATSPGSGASTFRLAQSTRPARHIAPGDPAQSTSGIVPSVITGR